MKTLDILFLRSSPVAKALSEMADVRGVLCFGSYAQGTFDQYSDLDLYVFCHPEITLPAARQEVLEKVEGIQALQVDYIEPGWEQQQWCPCGDRFCLNDIQFEITYNTVNWIQSVVRKVKTRGATSIPALKFRAHTMLGLLENSVILYDPDAVLQAIIAGLQPYPHKLRQTILLNNLAVMRGSIEEMQNYVLRNIGNTAFHFHLFRVMDALGAILFALNRRYDPATKRVEQVFRELDIAPPHFLDRYNAILETPLTPTGRQEIAAKLELLLRDIEELVI
jgi:predicted nucleotidyltransferase